MRSGGQRTPKSGSAGAQGDTVWPVEARQCSTQAEINTHLCYYGDDDGNDVCSTGRNQLLADIHAPYDEGAPGRLCVPANKFEESCKSALWFSPGQVVLLPMFCEKCVVVNYLYNHSVH